MTIDTPAKMEAMKIVLGALEEGMRGSNAFGSEEVADAAMEIREGLQELFSDSGEARIEMEPEEWIGYYATRRTVVGKIPMGSVTATSRTEALAKFHDLDRVPWGELDKHHEGDVKLIVYRAKAGDPDTWGQDETA
jgi:hypothetical protein